MYIYGGGTVWVYGRRCHNSGLHRVTAVARHASLPTHTRNSSLAPSRSLLPLAAFGVPGPPPALGEPRHYSFLPLTHSLSKKLNSWLVSATKSSVARELRSSVHHDPTCGCHARLVSTCDSLVSPETA